MTTLLPGARDVFTHGLTFNPNVLADFASNPAAIKTDGLDVFVQLVMAAIVISPSLSSEDSELETLIFVL